MRKKTVLFTKSINFRKYNRKKYSAFNSLKKLIRIATLGVTCSLIVSPIKAQTKGEADSISLKIDLEEVEVVGQKSTVLVHEIPRTVELIVAPALEYSPGQSLDNLLDFASNIDVRERGQFGIQSDISIRGGSFDQTLILLNGTNFSNPQTGHLSFNLPLDQETISKVEILNGPAARAHGANAYSGVINLIAIPENTNRVKTSINMGEYGFMRTHLSINYVTKNAQQLISAGHTKSDGYTINTDFNTTNLFYYGLFFLPNSAKLKLQTGYGTKKYGANSFYTPVYPDQFEINKNLFLSAGVEYGKEIKLHSQFYYNRNFDVFQLFRESKEYYSKSPDGYYINGSDTAGYTVGELFYPYSGHNYHRTDILGADLKITFTNKIGKTTFGAAVRSENIISNQLGQELAIPVPVKGADSVFYDKKASKNNFDIFAEHIYSNSRFFLSAGFMLHWNSLIPDSLKFFPGIDIGYNLTPSVKLVGSYNYTVGLPTFTDLDYQGPANSGNDKLLPYYQHSYETGIKRQSGGLAISLAGFYTKGKNNIEWVLNESNARFSPINVSVTENIGLEFSLRYRHYGKSIYSRIIKELFVGYTYIDSYKKSHSAFSKYFNIRHKFSLQLQQELFTGLNLSWNIQYKMREGNYMLYNFSTEQYIAKSYPDYILLDSRLQYTYKWTRLYIEAANITNTRYIEAGSIYQPGRWFKGGIVITIE